MKTPLIIIAILIFITQLPAQEIGFYTTYSGSSYNKYQSNIGLGIEYNHFIKSKSRIGVAVQYSYCTLNYSDIFGSSSDGISTYIKQVEPNNQRFALRLNYAFKVVNHPKSSLFIGPEIGLNYFFINEQVHRLEDENLTEADYQSKYSENNKFGFGFLIEFELKEVISKQISLYTSVHPEIISFERAGMCGSNNPTIIGWLNFNLGIKYNFTSSLKMRTRD